MKNDNSDTGRKRLLHEYRELIPMAVFLAVAVVHMIGQVTGHYQGLYAKTEGALFVQAVAIVAMMAAMLAYGFMEDYNAA